MGALTIDIANAEPGTTPQMVKATQMIVAVLDGFDALTVQSSLINAVAVVLIELTAGETQAIEETKRFCREVKRCIRTNYSVGVVR